MTTELLIQILLGVLIITCIFLIAVLWRMFGILSDAKAVSTVVRKRAEELNLGIEKFEKTVSEGLDAVKGFVYSLEFIKGIKEKIEKYKKGDGDGK